MSGFFFCGIRLECVENESLNSRKPNSVVLQMIKSSLRRERCKPIMARQKRNSQTKSRSPTASTLFWLTLEKPRSLAMRSRSRTMVDLALDTAQSVFNLLPFIRSYDSRPSECGGMRDRAGNIVPIKSPIEGEGFAVPLRESCSRLVESSFSHCLTTNEHE